MTWYWFSDVNIVETMRWPKASSSVLSMVAGRMPKLDATSRSTVDVQLRPGIGLVAGDVGDAVERSNLFEEDRRPVGQLVGIRVGQRVLILRLGQPRADGDVLGRLHVEGDALDMGELRLAAG